MIRFQPRLALLLCCAAVSSQVFADQNGTSQPQQRRQDDDLIRSIGHLERPDQAPAEPAPQLSMSVVPQSGPFRAAIFESVQVNVDSLGFNIPGDAANEPSIAIDPNFPTRIVIGWRQFDTVASNFRQAGWAFSQDGGLSWAFGGSLEPGEFSSDPVLDFDRQGNFYYYALQPIRGPVDWTCYLYKSFDGGITWPQEVYAFGGDKAWMAIDRTTGIGSGNIYVVWSPFASCCPGRFTRSTDGGLTYLEPISVPSYTFAAHLTVGPDGELYIVGAGDAGGTFRVTKSTNAADPALTPTFDLTVDIDLGGVVAFSDGPNPGGLLGQPWIAVNHSQGPERGHVYVFCSVNNIFSDDPMDVMFTRSTDGGFTWSPPVRVNDDSSTNAWQWFGTMSVAPDGRIDAVWNDTRESGQLNICRLYYANSIDGGVTWSQNVPLSPSFDSFVGWPNQNKLGDYYEMISDNAGANLAYAATFNGEQDVYFLRIPFDCNENGIPDDCDISCGAGGGRCDVPGCGTSGDCNANAAPDDCEPDFDCNGNGIQDICDIASGFSFDCNGDLEPDECPGCTDDCECTEIDPCWYGVCLAGACQVSPGIYGDTNHDGSVNVFDIFCILDGIAGQFSECGFDDIDIHPCGGNGTANLFDAFAVLEAITGIDACCGS